MELEAGGLAKGLSTPLDLFRRAAAAAESFRDDVHFLLLCFSFSMPLYYYFFIVLRRDQRIAGTESQARKLTPFRLGALHPIHYLSR